MRPDLTLNVGLRYEIDTDVKNISRYDEINPIVQPFLQGERGARLEQLRRRASASTGRPADGRTSVHGGYGIYYDRITLEIQSLERGLDGRALPIEVRAGNVFFLDPNTGQFPPFAPSTSNPVHRVHPAGRRRVGDQHHRQHDAEPDACSSSTSASSGSCRQVASCCASTACTTLGTHFIIGRTIGEVFNPVVGGPDRVVNLESSVNTHYDALLVSAERRGARRGLRASYTLGKALNYANDDQIPFANGPIDPNNLRLEYGPTPNDQRHRFTLAGRGSLPGGLQVAPIWTLASGVPMDILMPDAQSRIPALQRNAGGRLFKTAAELNAFIRELNAGGGVAACRCRWCATTRASAIRFNRFDAARHAGCSRWRAAAASTAIVEVFNLFNVTNMLGVSTSNYSGFTNVLVRDSERPGDPGFLTSSWFGHAVTTAGGVFGSGGPRAFQLGRARQLLGMPLSRELGAGRRTMPLVVGQVIAVGIFLTPAAMVRDLVAPYGCSPSGC